MSTGHPTDWQSRLTGALLPAVPVPFRADGSIDWDSQARYLAYMSGQPIDGVAVWAHTGRGLFLSSADRSRVLASWREGMGESRLIVAGVGAPAGDYESDDAYIEAAGEMADQARAGGADLIMAYAPVRFRGREGADEIILRYHKRLAEADTPMIVFYLYEDAGGISYSPEVLAWLLELPSVVAIKMATLDSVMIFQNVAALIRDSHPDVILITGEDRFLPYSLELGAKAALIGMGAACPAFQKHTMDAWFQKDYETYHRLAPRVDEFARATFRTPMEGYIRRMLHILAHQGVIDEGSAHDPFGPKVSKDDLAEVVAVVKELGIE